MRKKLSSVLILLLASILCKSQVITSTNPAVGTATTPSSINQYCGSTLFSFNSIVVEVVNIVGNTCSLYIHKPSFSNFSTSGSIWAKVNSACATSSLTVAYNSSMNGVYIPLTFTNTGSYTYVCTIEPTSGTKYYANPITITVGNAPQADFLWSSLIATPSTASPGQNINFNATYQNGGAVSAAGHNVTLFYSDDAVFNFSSDPMVYSSFQSQLSSSSFNSLSGNITIPISAINGSTGYIFAEIDGPGNGNVIESDETNNLLSLPITIQQSCNNTISVSTLTDETCSQANGTIVVSSNNAISFSNGSVTNSTGQFVNLSAGAYTVIATDANACNASTVLTLINSNFIAPSISIITNTTLPACAGQPILFTSTISNTTANEIFDWQINGITTGISTANFSSSVLQNGDLVSCNISFLDPCSSSTNIVSSNTISIVLNMVVANAGNNINLNCTIPSSIISVASISSNNYSWSPNVGLNNSNIAQPIASPLNTTTYTVIVSNTNGCSSTSTVQVVVDKTPPVATAGADALLNCQTSTAILGTNTVFGYSYNWAPSLGLSNFANAQVICSSNVSTTYTIFVTGSNGCTATDIVNVFVNNTIPIANAGADITLDCNILTSQILGSSNGGSIVWSPSTGLSSNNIPNPTVAVNTSTVYTMTVTDPTSFCTASDVVQVTVDNSLPVILQGQDASINCNIPSVNIGNLSNSNQNLYSWTPNNGLSSSLIPSPIAQPITTTIYTLMVTGANGCRAYDTIIVNYNKTIPVANAGQDFILNSNNSSCQLGAQSVTNYNYSWLPITALNSPYISDPLCSTTSSITYTLTITDITNGCSSIDVVNVKYENATELESTDRSGINISISPNPFSENLQIQNGEGFEFELYTSNGSKVYSMNKILSNKFDYNSSKLPTGMYLVVLKNEKIVKTFKVNKE
jgi:Secretion system C-terminal sorting domain